MRLFFSFQFDYDKVGSRSRCFFVVFLSATIAARCAVVVFHSLFKRHCLNLGFAVNQAFAVAVDMVGFCVLPHTNIHGGVLVQSQRAGAYGCHTQNVQLFMHIFNLNSFHQQVICTQ